MEKRTRKRPMPDARQVPGKITVLKSVSVGAQRGEEQSEETIEVRKFQSEPAYVMVKVGATKNLGDYESLRVDVSISMPCYPEEVDRVVEEVAEYAGDKLENEVQQYLEG